MPQARDGWLVAAFAAILLAPAVADGGDPGPFARIGLPDDWEARFWDDPDTKALLRLDPKALAALVPTQAGFRFCRCPACDADEAGDPLFWSATRPRSITCRRCGQSFPNEKIPAQVDKKVPDQEVEVLPGVTHHYPYQAVPAESQRYPDERLYLDAKRDYEARETLAKAALYAAVRHRERAEAGSTDPTLARFAATLVLRFAQVYPAYACHLDQPGQPKFLMRADLGPPYRRGYRSGKWEWTASLDVPLNLVTAYALLRDDPAWDEAGRLLDDPDPRRTIEHGFFRASAQYVRRQAEEFDEQSLQAYRGILAVGRLLDDEVLLEDARRRLALFAERGFYHDGTWRQGGAAAQRRVLQQLDGWIGRLSPGPAVPMLDLVREAAAVPLVDVQSPELQLASWPAPASAAVARRPALLGGVGVARLSVGGDRDGLDVEVRAMGSLDGRPAHRQSIRLAVAGRTVLDDLDDRPPTADGWDLATASHNAVLVDGLNQRETPALARQPAPGGQFLYFAADPDFQVVALDDPLAYPRSTTRYRQIVVAAAGAKGRYAVSVFQVFGGLQHDQVFHGPPGVPGRWTTPIGLVPGPESLLPRTIPYLPSTKAEDGRWFVQSYGEFRRLLGGQAEGPTSATLAPEGRPGVRLHAMGDGPIAVLSALTPDPALSRPPALAAEAGEGRASLILRRRSADGSTLRTTFVTVFEPIGAAPALALARVGRVGSTANAVVLALETADGPEHLVINLTPGTPQAVRLADGRELTTDGLAVRVTHAAMHLAGGTIAHLGPLQLHQSRLTGRVLKVGRAPTGSSRGWFEVEGAADRFEGVAGCTLLIRHGDDTVRGWTIRGVGPATANSVKLYVHEEPGFLVDPASDEAAYYQYPGGRAAGPHRFAVSRMTRGSLGGR